MQRNYKKIKIKKIPKNLTDLIYGPFLKMAVFEKGLYFKTKNKYIYISDIKKVNSLSISINTEDVQFIKNNNEFDLVLDDDTEIVDLELKGELLNPDLILEIIKNNAKTSGFGLKEMDFTEGYNYICNFLKNRKLEDLLGLGKGLTPSGDDFLIGFLAANRLARRNVSLNLDFNRTNYISGEFLRYALNGIFSEDLNEFLTKDISKIKNIISYGHTSGSDTLLGIYYAINNK